MIVLNLDIKKDTITMPGDVPSTDLSAISDVSVDTIISQVAPDNQPKKVMMGKKELKIISLQNKVYSFAIKCYLEQMPAGLASVVEKIIGLDKTQYQIIAILHDLDEIADGVWSVAKEKPHFHLIFRFVDRKKRIRIQTILEQLGIVFRKGLDDNLLQNRAVETVGNFAAYATYLTHETEDAIREAKEIYDMDRLISNLSEEEIMQVRDGYVRVSEKRKITQNELISLDREAYDLGRDMKNFTKWYDSQPFNVRSNAKIKVIRESYYRGVQSIIEEKTQVNRLCVFIQGDGNTGKTYASRMALSGETILMIDHGGTGKFDALRPDTTAIIVDDQTCPNLLNMCDNYICHAHRRNSNNQAWAGKYFIVTSNLSFEDWVISCGIKTRDERSGITLKNYEALLTRFFICRLECENGINRLALTQPSTRGTVAEQMECANEFVIFQRKFDEIIATYTPTINVVDFSSIIEPLKPLPVPSGCQTYMG